MTLCVLIVFNLCVLNLKVDYFIACSELNNINGTIYFPILYIDQVCTIGSM